MRINELKDKIDKLGQKYKKTFIVEKDKFLNGEPFLKIWASFSDGTYSVAVIELKRRYNFRPVGMAYYELPEELQEELFEVFIEFARTPTDKREEEKKYEYRLKEKYLWINDKLNLGNCYLNFEFSQEGGRGDVVLDSRGNTDSFKTEFTDGEIKEIVDMLYIDLEMFDKFEVK